MSLRAQRSNLPRVGLRLLRRYAPRNDILTFILPEVLRDKCSVQTVDGTHFPGRLTGKEHGSTGGLFRRAIFGWCLNVSQIQEKIAAVVVTYNRRDLLGQCLDSLLGQSRPLDALYIIDNHSTD